VVFAIIVWGVGKPVTKSEMNTVIGYVAPDRPAGQPNGLKVGDEVKAIDGAPVVRFAGQLDSITWAIVSAKNDDIVFDVIRDGKPQQITIHAPTEDDKGFKDWQVMPWYKKLWERPPLRMVGIGQPEDKVDNMEIALVMDNSPAAVAGIKKGDLLRKINGTVIDTHKIYVDALEQGAGKPLNLEMERDSKPLTFTISPAMPIKPEDYVAKGGKGELGFGIKDKDEEAHYIASLTMQHPSPMRQIKDVLRGTVATFSELVSSKSKIGAGHMSSALGIITLYHKLFSVPKGWMLVLSFTVMLNVGLAFMNMLPFPVLDGGHITMAIIEAITGKPLRGKLMETIMSGCVLMLLSFMVWVMLKDIGSWFKGDTLEFAPVAPAAGAAAK
jgi:regulator of sigma E protease